MEGTTSTGTQTMGVFDLETASQQQQLRECVVENTEMAQQDDETKSQGDSSLGEPYVGGIRACQMLPLRTKERNCASPWFILSMIVSATFFSAGLTFDFSIAKYFGLYFLYVRNLDKYIEFGYFGMNLVQGIFFLFFVISDGPYAAFLDDLGRRQRERGGCKLISNRTVNAINIILMAMSFIGAIMAALDGGDGLEGVTDWNLHRTFIKYHSLVFAMGIFCWDRTEIANYDYYEKVYGTVASARNIAFGVVNAVLVFFSFLLHFIIQDIVLTNTISFYLEIRESARICKEMAKDLTGARAQYFEIMSARKLDEKYNKAFSRDIRVMILNNICLFTLLAEEVLETNVFFLINVVLAANAIKAILFYWISCEIHSHGQTILLCAKTLDTTFEKIDVDGEEVLLKNVVHQMKTTPISVGRDGFVITEAFVMGVFSSVFTFFCLVAAARGKAS